MPALELALTCCGVVPGTSLETFSQTLGREQWNSDEFMNVRSIRSSATEREADTPLLQPPLFRGKDISTRASVAATSYS